VRNEVYYFFALSSLSRKLWSEEGARQRIKCAFLLGRIFLACMTSGFPLARLLLHAIAILCWGSLRKSAVVVNNQAGARSGLLQRVKASESRPPRRYILNDGGRVDLLFASSMTTLILWGYPPSLKAESRHTFENSFSVCKIAFTGSSQPWLERTQTTSIV
jgi:hypothetical protein